MSEVVYVSWGGTGRSEALRAAFERVGDARSDLRYLAILDDDQFGDLTPALSETVKSELEWLLAAQLRMIDLQTEQDVAFTIDVRQGDVEDVTLAVAKETAAELILLGAPLPANHGAARRMGIEELVDALRSQTGADVEIVGPEG
ncbi:MAG: nucleotide-binding universal stress UspA family protein [Verrucomicrobiales bacterium]|jgi:nucleotide-binding universal stress UspA family protein